MTTVAKEEEGKVFFCNMSVCCDTKECNKYDGNIWIKYKITL